LFNHEFTVRRPDREPERQTLRDGGELRRVREHESLLRLPEQVNLDQRLDSLPA
jgi:hypothetical protein